MVGGNQLIDRREKIRTLLGKEISLLVQNDSWDIKPFTVKGTLIFLHPDKGYFLADTNAQIPLPYVSRILPKKKLGLESIMREYMRGSSEIIAMLPSLSLARKVSAAVVPATPPPIIKYLYLSIILGTPVYPLYQKAV